MSGPRCTPGTCTHTVPHGSASTYRNHGCRCADCRAANVVKNQEGRIRRHAAMAAGEVSPPHGAESTYMNYMCRCDACRSEHTRRDRERRPRRAS